ncbi:MAG: monofunctional biosynthetic peptidoglycan transglycosylase [Proteobacteria bacterium]|nr:MAG: monofunctional biosynthetic peptidoglycan transglycosylase [Pseudomonadota bacterium]
MFKFFGSALIAIACFIGLILTGIALFLATTPRPTDLKTGCFVTKMFEVRLCPTDPDYVKLKNISVHARNAIIVSEDGAFYGHQGFDWTELKNSFDKNMETGEFARGGSTITQQLAKNVYLSPEKSILRKVREAMITVQIENLLTKDEILEKYLNVVEFGENLYGIGKASKYYFKKSPASLTPAEGAFLAFLLPNPKKYSQSFRAKKLTRFAGNQVRVIVDRLYKFKKIDEVTHESALAQVTSMFGAPPDADAVDPLLENDLENGATPDDLGTNPELTDTPTDL